jgi:VanZ family protein
MNFLRYWGLVIVWAVLLFYLSGLPHLILIQKGIVNAVAHIVAHFIMYYIFAFLLARAFVHDGMSLKKSMAVSFLIALLYAMGDEYHQLFIPGRYAEIQDVLVDGAGAALAVRVFYIYIIKQIAPHL